MSRDNFASWCARVLELGPFGTDSEVEAASIATVRALGEELLDDERSWLVAELPQELAQALTQGHGEPAAAHARTPDKRDFFKRVAHHERVTLSRAVEHAEVVCQTLAEVASPETVEHLKKHLPTLADLFEPRPTPEPPVHAPHPNSRAPTDLAEGRPGGTHPVSTSDLSSLAHRHSVARSQEPHADTKLSSAHGLRQEREGRTLATGKPGARRKLSDSH